MKKFIILLVLALTGCCPLSETTESIELNNVPKRQLYVNNQSIEYYEITNPFDGHDYYVFNFQYTMIHSPECKKCKKPTSVLDGTSLFDY